MSVVVGRLIDSGKFLYYHPTEPSFIKKSKKEGGEEKKKGKRVRRK